MKKLLVLVGFLLIVTQQARSNSCAATATGNWNAAGTWTSCGGTFPGVGDTATIGSAFVVTIPASTTATVGTDGATGTAAVTLSSTSQLVINGTLDARGDLIEQLGVTVTGGAGGTLILDSLAGKQYKWQANTTGSGSSFATTTGTAWTAGNFFTVNGAGGRGGTNGTIDFSNGSTARVVDNFAYTIFENLGDASHDAFDQVGEPAGSGPASNDTQSHVVWLICGFIHISLSNATNGINWNAVDFRGLLGTGSNLITIDGAIASSVVRSMKNITIYNTTNIVGLQINNAGITASNWILYNIEITAPFNIVSNMTFNSLFWSGDLAGFDPIFSLNGDCGNVVQNSVFLTHFDNPHYVGLSSGCSATPTIVFGNVFDGDGYFLTDAGDLVLGPGVTTIKNNININMAGTILTALSASAKFTLIHNTSFGSDGGSVGETAGAATQMIYALNNLFSSMDPTHGGNNGFHQQSAFVSQSSWTMDYTGYFNMPAGNITQPILGNNSYLGPATFNPWFASGAFGDNGKGLHDITGDPQFVDNTRTVRGYGGWASVQAAAREMVTINGIDYTGATVTATAKTVPAIISYIQVGFTPTNSIYIGTGSDGTNIGASGGYATKLVGTIKKVGTVMIP